MTIFKNLFLVGLLAGANSMSAAETMMISMSKAQLDALGIKLGNLVPVEQIPFLTAPATVVIPPAQEYIVSASQAGLIHKLYVSVGDKVEKGDILARLNSPELLALQQHLLKANSQRQLAWASYQRDQQLFNEGIIANKRWQETRAEYNSNASQANEARQLLEIAGMSKKAIDRLAKTRRLSSQLDLFAPIAGVVLERLAVAGERIDRLAPVYRMANLDELWLEIRIPQERINGVNVGDRVMISNHTATALITLIGQSVNTSNQTVLARAEIEGGSSTIRAGQTVNIQIIQTSNSASFRVPNAAIAHSGGQSYIFIRTETGFVVQPVNLLGKEGSNTIISSNLAANTKIAIRGAVALKANWLGLGGDE